MVFYQVIGKKKVLKQIFPHKDNINEDTKIEVFISKTVDELNIEYIYQYIDKIAKGITKEYRIIKFDRNDNLRNMHNITESLLKNNIYSNIIGVFIFKYLNTKDIKMLWFGALYSYNVFGFIKNNWICVNKSLNEICNENARNVIKLINDKIIEIKINLETVATKETLNII